MGVKPFAWFGYYPSDAYSDVFNALVGNGKITLKNEDDVKKYSLENYNDDDVEEALEELYALRDEYKKELLAIHSKDKDYDADEIVKKAYPYELIFQYKY